MTRITARTRYLRIAPRKVRHVIDVIRGLSVERAETQLQFLYRGAARPVLQCLKSAIANAKENFQIEKNQLRIHSITADEGTVLKRWKPRAFGRATPIRKRSTHLTIVLESSGEAKKKEQAVAEPISVTELERHEEKGKRIETPRMDAPSQTQEEHRQDGEEHAQRITKRQEPSWAPRDVRTGKKEKGFLKKFFSRKTG